MAGSRHFDFWINDFNRFYGVVVESIALMAFSFFKKEKNNQPEEAGEQAVQTNQPEHNFIIHNMPSANRLQGRFSNTGSVNSIETDAASANSAPESNDSTSAAPKRNFKAVGLVIIAGGLIFIGGLVYLTFHFIISPTASGPQTIVTAPIAEQTAATSTPLASSTIVTPTPSSADLNEAVPTVLDSTVAAETSTEMVMNEEAPKKTAADFPPLIDSDADGLNDEEEAVLGTSSAMSDTDGDAYADLAEINNGYNPAGEGKLSDNVALTVYTSIDFNYSILFPKEWGVETLSNQAVVVFTAPDESLIQISVQENPDGTGILNWYESSFSDVTVTYDKMLSADTWDGIMGADGLDFYLTDKNHKNVFIISYVSAVTDRIAYPKIFELMISSLVIK